MKWLQVIYAKSMKHALMFLTWYAYYRMSKKCITILVQNIPFSLWIQNVNYVALISLQN